ncbi:PD-(D/E)XK nuclease family protein [Kitasatospora sp. NBC_01250]|uniref:PD-(D/E)XK nuclease family protein n=1 Tax=Kitasatospora sp. NBC_01250 TaxID=2903571 RepID=UPI002E340A7F|nr:PD-(D/E)XK nuclease family protein [Kitasatospora sp. NBC_01250]
MRQWLLPPAMAGDPGLVRIGPGTVGDEDYSCPEQQAARARPAVYARAGMRLPKPRLETFTLAPVMAALDRIELHGDSVEAALEFARRGKPAHPGVLTFAEHAVRSYVGRSMSGMRPVPDFWVAQKNNGTLWELYAWGRRYESQDGRRREFVFLRFGEAGARERDRGQIAIAAYATAFGAPARWPQSWSEPFTPNGSATAVEQVRVVEVGLSGGPPLLLFEGTPSQVTAYFADYGRREITEIAAGGLSRPGSPCAGCKLLTSCDALPRIPGLLGISSRRAPLRKVSVSDLRYYGKCPAQAHMSSVHLPRAAEYSDEAKLGQAVHGWLETSHRGRIRAACNGHDVPRGDRDWTGGRWTMTGEWARLGSQMIAHHTDVCPYRDASSITEVELEPALAFHDTAAQTIVIAKPDMIYLQDNSWVWRETKTTQKPRFYHSDLLDEFPQLALALVLLAEGALGGELTGSRVELEVLRPQGQDLLYEDPTDPLRVAKAREVLRKLAEPWRGDEDFEARPGRACQTCPVSRWCPSSPGISPTDEATGATNG